MHKSCSTYYGDPIMVLLLLLFHLLTAAKRREANAKQSKVILLFKHKAMRTLGTATQNVLRHGAPRVSSPLGQRLVDSSPAGFRFPASDSASILTGHIEQARRISFEASTPRGRSLPCLLYSVRRVGAPGVGLVVRARGSAQSRSWTPQPGASPQL